MIAILRTFWPSLALLGGFTGLFLLLRNRTSPVTSLEAIAEGGQPAVVELFSNL